MTCPDRISDVIIFVGAAHSGLCHILGGYWVAIFALVVAYVGISGQAVGVQREFSGLMSKPWRMVFLHLGSWITLGLLWWGDGRLRYGGLTVLDWTNVIIIAGCLQNDLHPPHPRSTCPARGRILAPEMAGSEGDTLHVSPQAARGKVQSSGFTPVSHLPFSFWQGLYLPF